MKKHVIEFLKRGLMFCAGGPVILAIIYAVIGATGEAQTLTTGDVSLGILTVTLLAFIAAGFTVVYQIEELPLFAAALIHGAALYLDYILIYLLNGWLVRQWKVIGIFTAAFVAGYAIIWLIIYLVTKSSTGKLNRQLGAQ